MELIPEFTAFSFPSSHATFATLFCGIIIVLVSTGISAPFKIAAWAVGFFISVLVAVSRVYLDAQWASDVLAGLLLGLALTAVFAMIRNGFQDEVGHKVQVPLIAFAAFLAIAAVKSSITFDEDLVRSTPRVSIAEMRGSDWLADGWTKLPQRRVDLLGETEEPLFVQTAIEPARLAPHLAERGWQVGANFAWTDLLFFLVPAAPLESFPPLPVLHGGRPPEATFVKSTADPDKRIVLRFWLTRFALGSGQDRRPLMVGAITEERVTHPYQAMSVILDRAAPPEAVEEARRAFGSIAGRDLAVAERAAASGTTVLVGPP
jgi:undecaprenyl-diphosphatase